MILRAFAKINWTLDVLGKRPDGYHEIASVMQTLELHDVLTLSRIPAGIVLDVDGPEAEGVPTDERNLIWRAATALGSEGVQIALEKNIPSQAGLGGGSSDAAATLTGINRLFGLGRTREQLAEIGTKLGADVPFFLYGGTARVEGIGERISPLPNAQGQNIVLVKPPVGVSTKAAYDALDARGNRPSADTTRRWPDGGLSNDFEAVIYDLYPAVAAARDALRAAGASATLLCGSGAAVLGLGGDIQAIAARVRAANVGKVWVTRAINAMPSGFTSA